MTSAAIASRRSTDFDFLTGRWTVANRRLKERFVGCTDWETFPGEQEAWPLLGGLGNVDRYKAARPGAPDFEGATVRVYDPARDLWTIYWMDSIGCRLDYQVEGRFKDGVGVFEGQEEAGGRTRKLRFKWRQTGAATARWEQAYYLDETESWETNWIMEFTRVPEGTA